MLKAGERPDFFLVVARSDLTVNWRLERKLESADTWLLSLSECASSQEAMLLMPPKRG